MATVSNHRYPVNAEAGAPFRTPLLRSLPGVEAGRIELPSCIRSSAAPTCVARRLMSPAAGRQAAHCWMSRLEIRAAADDGPQHYPGFAILHGPPREGFLWSTAGVTGVSLSYAARAKF